MPQKYCRCGVEKKGEGGDGDRVGTNIEKEKKLCGLGGNKRAGIE